MAKIKLKAVLTATVIYEVDEAWLEGGSVADMCRREETAIREDPTEFCDSGKVKFDAKVEKAKGAK